MNAGNSVGSDRLALFEFQKNFLKAIDFYFGLFYYIGIDLI